MFGKKKIYVYCGNNSTEKLTGFCWKCKKQHALFPNEWAMTSVGNKFRFQCIESLSEKDKGLIKAEVKQRNKTEA